MGDSFRSRVAYTPVRILGSTSLFARPSSQIDIIKSLTTTQERQKNEVHAISYGRLISGLKAWCSGATISEISEHMLETAKTKSKSKNSRKLAVRWAPEASFALGSVARMYKYKCDVEQIEMPLCLGVLASMIRHGVDSPEKLAILHTHEYQISRPRVNALHNDIAEMIPQVSLYAPFRDVLIAVADALDKYTMYLFDDYTPRP